MRARRTGHRSETVACEERSHGGDEARGVVAHHGVARAGDLGYGGPWPLAAEPLGRLGGEDRALGPADEERRRPHAPHVLPERLELEVDRAEDRRVELVGPAPVGSLAKGMSQSLADVLDRPAGVERLRGSHRVLEGIEVASRELARDRVAPPALD